MTATITATCPDCGAPLHDGWHVLRSTHDVLTCRAVWHGAPVRFKIEPEPHNLPESVQDDRRALAAYFAAQSKGEDEQ